MFVCDDICVRYLRVVPSYMHAPPLSLFPSLLISSLYKLFLFLRILSPRGARKRRGWVGGFVRGGFARRVGPAGEKQQGGLFQ